MSTSRRVAAPAKNTSCWVRPGVREVRAGALRPVSALIRLDLPTWGRAANAISMARVGGSAATLSEAAMNCQSPVNSLRPASVSCGEKSVGRPRLSLGPSSGRAATVSALRRLLADEERLDVVPQLDLGTVPVHDEALLGDRERIVPGPVDHQAGGEVRQHEGEDDRHPV